MLHCSLSFNYELSFPGVSLSLIAVRTSALLSDRSQCSYFLVEPIPGYGKYLNMRVASEILMNFQIHMDYFSH
jgi:hypothetical protein